MDENKREDAGWRNVLFAKLFALFSAALASSSMKKPCRMKKDAILGRTQKDSTRG